MAGTELAKALVSDMHVESQALLRLRDILRAEVTRFAALQVEAGIAAMQNDDPIEEHTDRHNITKYNANMVHGIRVALLAVLDAQANLDTLSMLTVQVPSGWKANWSE